MTSFAVRGVTAAVVLLLTCRAGAPAEPFPFDQELLLDAAPMRPGKRMPILNIESNGNARIDLWCRTVTARIEISDATMKIETSPLPEGAPEMLSAGQCTPERMQADEELLSALAQVSGWRRENSGVLLEGPKTLKFRLSDH
jgi:heat shock protein HslJ